MHHHRQALGEGELGGIHVPQQAVEHVRKWKVGDQNGDAQDDARLRLDANLASRLDVANQKNRSVRPNFRKKDEQGKCMCEIQNTRIQTVF